MQLFIINQDGSMADIIDFDAREIMDAHIDINRAGNIILYGAYQTYNDTYTQSTGKTFLIELDEQYQIQKEIIITPPKTEDKILAVRVADLIQNPETGAYFMIASFIERKAKKGRLFYPQNMDVILKIDESFDKVKSILIPSKSHEIVNHISLSGDSIVSLTKQIRKVHKQGKIHELNIHLLDSNLEYKKTYQIFDNPIGVTNILSIANDELIFGGGRESFYAKKLKLQ